jgi:sortase A
MALLVLVLLLVLLLVVVLAVGSLGVGGMGDERPGQVDAPTFEEASEEVDEPAGDEEESSEEESSEEESSEEESSEEKSPEEEATEDKEEPVPAAPDDPTLFLTVPKLGLYNHTVRNDDSEQALDLGAIKMPGTDFPWQEGDKNTYIACHRLGWPGTESHNQCLNLPSIREGDEIFLKDTNGMDYEYRVSETLTVGPSDSWVMEPLTGKDVLSLQTCIEAPGDFLTLGPNWLARFVVRAERI